MVSIVSTNFAESRYNIQLSKKRGMYETDSKENSKILRFKEIGQRKLVSFLIIHQNNGACKDIRGQ